MIHIENASVNNLRNISVNIPENKVICFTGKSGSGKSTLAYSVLYTACKNKINKCDSFHVSKILNCLALPQKENIPNRFITGFQFLGLHNFILKNSGSLSEQCPCCHGAGYKLFPRIAIGEIIDSLQKHSCLQSISKLLNSCLKKNNYEIIPSELNNIINSGDLDEDTVNLLSYLFYPSPCTDCHGVGLINYSDDIISKFFSNVRKATNMTNENIIEYAKLQYSLCSCGSTAFLWQRLYKLLLNIQSDSLIILDEPMAGLCINDAQYLLSVIRNIQKNTHSSIILIEHSPVAIMGSDYIIEFGPGAGRDGGLITYSGNLKEYLKQKTPISSQLPVSFNPTKHNSTKKGRSISINSITEGTFENLFLQLPLKRFICISGTAGTGKTTLLNNIQRAFDKGQQSWCNRFLYDEIKGRSDIRRTQFVSQSPIGNNPHSTPATYLDLMIAIRKKYADIALQDHISINFEDLSYNSPSGWCPICKGRGGSFDIDKGVSLWNICPECHGIRYNKKVQQVLYNNMCIGDFINLTAAEAINYSDFSSVVRRAQLLTDIGLSYIHLSQPSGTLSGGESQRIKLSKYLAKKLGDRMLYLLDTPTRGLSIFDVVPLVKILQQLSKNNTVVVADNNPVLMQMADWLIVIGDNGNIIYQGVPANIPDKLLPKFFQN